MDGHVDTKSGSGWESPSKFGRKLAKFVEGSAKSCVLFFFRIFLLISLCGSVFL